MNDYLYENADNQGRKIWLRDYDRSKVADAKPLEDKNYLDIAFTAVTGEHNAVEIKCRDYSSTKYPDWVLEDHKYQEILEAMAVSGLTSVYYANYFNDNQRAVWDVTPELIKKSRTGYQKLGKATVEDNGNIWKKIYYLKIEDSIGGKTQPFEGKLTFDYKR